jgi:hypothetical protein
MKKRSAIVFNAAFLYHAYVKMAYQLLLYQYEYSSGLNKGRYAMTNKNSKSDVNEELPEEYEVIQHSLRNSEDKKRKSEQKQQSVGTSKPPGSGLDKADSSANGVEEKNKHQK